MRSKHQYYAEIREYYSQSNWLYKYVWYAGRSLGLHFGFADGTTASHTEALINQYKYVIRKGIIEDGMQVLDAGCGVGGASIHIARKTGAQCTGISIVPEQIVEARKNAIKAGVGDRVNFLVADYAVTELPSATFDVVFGMESVCYATSKKDFVAESYRVLKPGGMLVLTDGYRKREVKNRDEKQLMKTFCEGWRLADLVSVEDVTRAMRRGGFGDIVVEDKTSEIEMSINKMKRLVGWWRIGEQVLGWVNLPIVKMARANASAMEAWIMGVERGLFGYYAHVAQKPAK